MADLVTETDTAVENLIINTLKTTFPNHSFIGEESVASGLKCQLTENPTWIIDPIDGTSNFVHKYTHVAISIALMINKEAKLGIVYNPITELMYSAKLGQGAYCNGEKLKVNSTKDISKALFTTEFGSQRVPAIMDSRFRTMRKVIDKAHGIRSCGSAAISMIMVAAGHVDAYYEFGMHCWDIAAGDLIVREAGGVIMNMDGSQLDIMSRQVLCATTMELAQQIIPIVEHIEFESD